MSERKAVWLLDPRFDFLIPGFLQHFQIEEKNLTLVGSYHGPTRAGRNTVTVGDSQLGHVVFLEPEDLNRRYAPQLEQDAPDVVAAFTGAYLPNNPSFETVLATGKIAIDANNKRWQECFFRKHGIPAPRSWNADGKDALLALVAQLLPNYKRLVIKLPELSGGYQMVVVNSIVEAEKYLAALPDTLPPQFQVSEYIAHSQSFAGMAVVSKGGTVNWCGATEQVLYHDLAYEGLIYPPFASQEVLQEMEDVTRKIGKGLADEGYFGFFNADFLLGESGLQVIEINARFCFCTLLYACFSHEQFWNSMQGVFAKVPFPEERIILGKIKSDDGVWYSNLTSKSDILQWAYARDGRFQSFFCGLDSPEYYEYGSFIGLFGEFLPFEASRDAVLNEFWKNCLAHY